MIHADMNCPDNLPRGIFEGIRDYVLYGIEPGSFIMALMMNDLQKTVAQASPATMDSLLDIVRFVYWEIPSKCHGSPKIVHEWIRAKGLRGVAS